MEDRACRSCRLIISHGDTCPICGSKDLTDRWSGYIVMLNMEKSSIAKILGIKMNSTYAINIA
jgi:DNA-directed RNA polymerase subunit E"